MNLCGHGGRYDYFVSRDLQQFEQISTGQKNLGAPDRLGYVPAEVRSEKARIAATFPTPPRVVLCRRDPPAPGCEIYGQIDAALNRKLARRPFDTDPFAGDYSRDGYERQSCVLGLSDTIEGSLSLSCTLS